MKNISIVLVSLFYINTVFAHTDKESEPRVHLSTIKILGADEKTELFEGASAALKVGGRELYRKGENSLGASLNSEPGVNATDFGVAASRPVIRGFGGERVKILQNGIGLLDVSGTSDDHVVPLSALNSDSLEIIRGPLNLLYGASAIGGVLNVVNSRIHEDFYEGFSGAFDSKLDSVKSYRRLGAKFDYGASNIMYHFDGEISKSGLLETPDGDVVNSQADQTAAAVGFTYFTKNKNSFGLSYSNYSTNYGVVVEEDVTIDQAQNRIDFSGNIKLKGFFKQLKIKSAQTFYKHREFEGAEVGTTFENEGNETRLEFVQAGSDRLEGLVGLQLGVSEFSALGEEAFLPLTESQNAALFAFEKLKTEKANYSLGLRFENAESDSEGFEARDFSSTSLAFRVEHGLTNSLSLDWNLSYTQRAPNFQELFANGAHVATSTFEIGDPNLDKEKALGVEVSLIKQNKKFKGKLIAFAQDFNDYINLEPTGGVEDGLPEFRYVSLDKARIYGLELEALVHLNSNFDFKLVGDLLRGEDRESDSNLPRISPVRLSGEFIHEWKSFRSHLKVQHTFEQNKVSSVETSTDGFTIVNLGTSYEFLANNQRYVLYAQLNNIFDELGRNHLSFVKDLQALPGFGAAVGIQGYF